MQFLTRRIKSRLIGTIYLYFINAYTDAYLAEKLDDSSNVSHFSDRIELLQHYSTKWKIPDTAFIYTQYYLNGLYDYAYAQLFMKLLVLVDRRAAEIIQEEVNRYRKLLNMHDAYTEFSSRSYALLKLLIVPIWEFLLGKLPFEKTFSQQFPSHLHSFSPEIIVPGIMMVEMLNIQSNHQQVQMIKQYDGQEATKIVAIRLFTSRFGDDETLIEQAIIATLKAASRWDALFKMFLQVRFRANSYVVSEDGTVK
ncbi:hypothetical protein KC571_03875 [candidate division WWE3 bacterium]|uniref:Uncharacterized protein n=1 Tax=candidate division WWE3 bacterium TaxID=2053526 RepID=A0A955LHU3_UNCKA|nr:hypothetical protein [candidate division WWE3 bacterium]